jgi:hypothetical protein
MSQRPNQAPGRAVDKLVVATVNAPYRRAITAQTLAACLADAAFDGWIVHVTTFFTDLSSDLVLDVAAQHGISNAGLAKSYFTIKRRTGEGNPGLESKLASLAAAAP